MKDLLLRVFNRMENFSLRVFNRLSRQDIAVHDTPLVGRLKKKYGSGQRVFVHGWRQNNVDCLKCHAVPGTLETTLGLLDALPVKKKCLNIGGGSGDLSSMLSDIGYDVWALDIEVDKPSERNMVFDLNSAEPLPFPDGSFDAILCQEVIEHIENPWALFRRAYQLLAPGGHIVVTTPNISSLHSRARFALTGFFDWFTPDCHSYHINPISQWELELVGKKAGLELVQMVGNGSYYFPDDKGSLMPHECLISLWRKN